MADTIRLEIASPERSVFEGDVSDLQAPAVDGYLGVLPGHAPLVTVLGSGVLSFVNGEGEKRYLMVQGGLMEILPDRVRAVTSFAVWEHRALHYPGVNDFKVLTREDVRISNTVEHRNVERI